MSSNGPVMSGDGLLKMSELAERSGVSAGTIKHYLREGLLGSGEQVVRTSRNMAYYPADFVERVRLIKRLQEERFMPLRVIREVMASDPDRAARLIELEDRILERAIEARETGRVSRANVRATYDVPQNVLERLEEIGVLTPTARGYDADDVSIIEAISRFRAGGYEQAIGFTVYDTLRYREALEPLVEDEVRVLLERLAGTVEVDRAVEIIASGASPLRDLIGAMHSKMLLAALRRAHPAFIAASTVRCAALDRPRQARSVVASPAAPSRGACVWRCTRRSSPARHWRCCALCRCSKSGAGGSLSGHRGPALPPRSSPGWVTNMPARSDRWASACDPCGPEEGSRSVC